MPQKGDLTRKRIVKIARDLFYQKGFDATSTAEIARHAALSEAAMYKYFKSKKALLIASVQPTVEIEDAEDYTSYTNEDLIERWMTLFLEKVEKNLPHYIILFNESVKYPELSETYLKTFYVDMKSEMEIRHRMERGRIPHFDFTLMQVGIIGALIAMLQHLIIHKQRTTLIEIPLSMKETVRSIMNGKFFEA